MPPTPRSAAIVAEHVQLVSDRNGRAARERVLNFYSGV
jgi:undecaprenyl pyrophosphate synthase